MEIAVIVFGLIILMALRKTIGAWTAVAEAKSLDVAQRARVDSFKYNSKTNSKLDALDDALESTDLDKLIKAKRKATMARLTEAAKQD